MLRVQTVLFLGALITLSSASLDEPVPEQSCNDATAEAARASAMLQVRSGSITVATDSALAVPQSSASLLSVSEEQTQADESPVAAVSWVAFAQKMRPNASHTKL